MKKPIYLLFALFMLSMVSCNYATNAKGKTMTDDPVAKENKSLVQEKKYVSNDACWTVKLIGKLIDTRTMLEKYKGEPIKNDIVNSVLFNSNVPLNELKTSKGTPYYPSFEVQKTIKHKTNEIIFTINVNILTFPHIQLLQTKPLQIHLYPKNVVDFNNNDIEILYKENTELKAIGIDGQNIICKSTIPIEIINKIRAAQNDVVVLLNADNDVFNILLPKIFIEYLNEM